MSGLLRWLFASLLLSQYLLLALAETPSAGLALPALFMPTDCADRHGICYVGWSVSLAARFMPGKIVYRLDGSSLELKLPGSNPSAIVTPGDPLSGRLNFLFGVNASKFRTNVPLYSSVRYPEIYPGIDLVFRADSGSLKSEFVIAPGGDPKLIRLRYGGARISVDGDGNLRLLVKRATVREAAPLAYQISGKRRTLVPAAFVIGRDGDVHFHLSPHDQSRELVIDPTLTYSAVINGSHDSVATAIAADSAGNVYFAGWTDSINFPIVAAEQLSSGGGNDAFVVKLNPQGDAILYATFLGGTGDDRAFGITLDAAGEATVAGWTQSSDFPTLNASQPALSGGSGQDAFVARLNAAGNSLIFSTFLGGSGTDAAWAVALNAQGNIYVTGDTQSTNFPVLAPIQGACGGRQDAFLTEFTSVGVMIFSTYLGGNGDDHGAAITVDLSGDAIVAGSTYSTNFPTVNPFQPANAGGQDAFLLKISPGGQLLYGTYLGGAGGSPSLPEGATGVASDPQGNLYLAGITSSQNFPVVNPIKGPPAYGTDIFVTKLNPQGSALIYSTYLGGSSFDFANSLLVDGSGNAYVGGQTSSWDFPTVFAYQPALGGMLDGFVMKVNPAGTALNFSTYIGGSANDAVNAIAADGQGNLYLAGQTSSVNFPTAGGILPQGVGGLDAFVMSLGGVASGNGLAFVPVTPCRVADTRNPPGPFGGPTLTAGNPRSFAILASNCSIPSNAEAYFLNLTAVPQGELGWLTIWPAGQPQPDTSTLNSLDGRTKANAAIVSAGAGGDVSLAAAGTVDVAIDISGYFVPTGTVGGLEFYPVAPCRLVDTRGANGPFGGPFLQPGTTRSFVISGYCGVPSTAQAFSLNVTAVPHGFLGYLAVWPSGTPWLGSSTLNAPTGTNTANAALTAAGASGGVNVLATNSTDVLIDVNGYFAPSGGGGMQFYSVSPCRLVDTRNSPGPLGGPSLLGIRNFPVPSGPCPVPEAVAYSMNATVVPYGTLSYLTLWDGLGSPPVVSTLNALDGSIVSNAAIVPASSGLLGAFSTNMTDLILDFNGYFAP